MRKKIVEKLYKKKLVNYRDYNNKKKSNLMWTTSIQRGECDGCCIHRGNVFLAEWLVRVPKVCHQVSNLALLILLADFIFIFYFFCFFQVILG